MYRFESNTCLLLNSGAGKTTLLDVIAGYKTGGRIAGDIMIDGALNQDKIWKRISGYAEQSDILNPYLSALETLRFTAACCLSNNVNSEAVINHAVELMGLKEWLDVVVGRELEGEEALPKHARKWLTIAVQLVVQPRILFLDEPTTGLGTNAATLVIASIRRATDALGLITLATIHQPSKVIWVTFDDLLLLAKDGNVSYMGEMGPKSQTVLNHFMKLSKEDPPPSCNPADYVLLALTSVEPEQAVATFEGTEEKTIVHEAIDQDLQQEATAIPGIDLTKANSHFMEILLLSKRQLVTQWRNPSYTFIRLISSVLVSMYMGILFFGDKSTIDGAVFSIGAIFFLVFVLVIPMAAAVVPLIEDRAVLYRETVSGTYSRLSYGIGSLIADIPFHMLNTFLMFIFFYFLVDFNLDGPIVGYFILMLFMANWVIMSMGQLYPCWFICHPVSDFNGFSHYCQCHARGLEVGLLGESFPLHSPRFGF
jgi:ABC-type multidrug transport system ATPase subunit